MTGHPLSYYTDPTKKPPPTASDITTLPQSYLLELANVANETGAKQAKDEAAVYAQIRAYYDLLIAANQTNPAQLIALKNARAAYVIPAGSKPPPLTGTGKSGQLPIGLQTAIDKAKSDAAAGGSTAPEIAAIQKAIDYVNAQIPKTKDKSVKDTLYQERTSLYNELASAKQTAAGTSTATPSGVGVLPPGLQASLTNAQTAAASQSAVAGTFNPQNLQAQRALHEQDLAALRNIAVQIDHQKAGSKELRALEAERLTLTHEMLAAQKQITEELKNQKTAAFDAFAAKVFHVNPDGTPLTPGAQSLRTRERQILLADAKRHGDLTAGMTNEPLGALIKQLTREGALPKSSIAALKEINAVINESIKKGVAISSTWSQLISAKLTQINDTLKQATGFASSYRGPTPAQMAASIPGFKDMTHEQKVALIASYAAKVVHHGTLPAGGAVGGVPLGADGRPLTHLPRGRAVHSAAVPARGPRTREDIHGRQVQDQIAARLAAAAHHLVPRGPHHLPSSTPVDKQTDAVKKNTDAVVKLTDTLSGHHTKDARVAAAHHVATHHQLTATEKARLTQSITAHSGEESNAPARVGTSHAPPLRHTQSASMVIHKVEIHLPNVKDGHQAAQDVRDELLKTARRNPTQTKGPNAGRRIGMN